MSFSNLIFTLSKVIRRAELDPLAGRMFDTPDLASHVAKFLIQLPLLCEEVANVLSEGIEILQNNLKKKTC